MEPDALSGRLQTPMGLATDGARGPIPHPSHMYLDAPYIYRGVQVHYCTPLPVRHAVHLQGVSSSGAVNYPKVQTLSSKSSYVEICSNLEVRSLGTQSRYLKSRAFLHPELKQLDVPTSNAPKRDTT